MHRAGPRAESGVQDSRAGVYSMTFLSSDGNPPGQHPAACLHGWRVIWASGDVGGGSRNSWTGPLHRTSRAESRWVCRACAAGLGHVHAPAQDPRDPQPWTQAGILRAKARGLAGGRKVHPGADICTAQPGWSPWTTSMLS